MPFQEFLSSALMFFTWRDAIEIIFFSAIIYIISLWLKKDSQKNLLGYFYLYCLLFFVSYQLHLPTITYTLAFGAPIIAMLFILMHQRTLQKNFIALRSITPAMQDATPWLETLMQVCMTSIDNQQEISCIIEYRENLETLLTTPLALHADIKKELLEILIASTSFDHKGMLWLNTQGKILGINTTWLTPFARDITLESTNYHTWKEAAIFFTTATDAIIIRTLPASRTFSIAIQGQLHEQLRAPAALTTIKAYLQKQAPQTKGDFHVQPTATQNEQQRSS